MNQNYINTNAMEKAAKNSKNKETYQLIEKNQKYRIGAGARATSSPSCSFFVEVILNSSPSNEELDVEHVAKVLRCLKTLKSRNYSLTSEDSDYFACEKTIAASSLNSECSAAQDVLNAAFK